MTVPRRSRRAFALPAVLLLTLTVGIVTAAMLQRESAQSLLFQRQLGSYRAHHLARGVREVVGQWAVSLSGQPLENMIAEDGRILDLETSDGTVVRVSLADGQGAVLTDLSKLAGSDRTDARAVLRELDDITRGRPDPAWLRPVGPMRISASSAPEEVLEAVARVLTKTKAQATAVTRAILQAREDGPLDEAKLAAAAGRGGLNAEDIARLNRLLTPRAELWLLVADVHEPDRRGRTRAEIEARYRGYIAFGQGSFGAASGLDSLGSFLSWEEVPLR